LSGVGVAAALIALLWNYVKIAPRLPGWSFFARLKSLHVAPPKHKFYDTTLNRNVGYAKHAISIDENRADFKRVPWSPTAEKADKRDALGNLYFEQVWFPGVHADIGGGYLENEARLSDAALKWMVAGASLIPDGLKHDGSVLRLSPDPAGPQHNEQAGGFLKAGVRHLPVDPDTGESASPMHKSVTSGSKQEASCYTIEPRTIAPTTCAFMWISSITSIRARLGHRGALPKILSSNGRRSIMWGGYRRDVAPVSCGIALNNPARLPHVRLRWRSFMRQAVITVVVGLVMLGAGLAIGHLQEVSQQLIFAGLIVLVVYGSAAAVFIVALYRTFKLWQIVLDALQGAKSGQAKALLQILGGVSLSGSNKVSNSTQTIRITGSGLLGTLVIMGFACFVVYVMFSIVPRDSDIVKIGGRPAVSSPQ
jgi:Uncharacterized alpha/beta hydrolase domain (DUF2235)